MSPRLAHRVADFGTTIFSEMTALAARHNAINLGQGYPDFDGPESVKATAIAAITAGQNQYAAGIGQLDLRTAVAEHARRFYGQDVDPVTMVTITCGATEAIFSAIQGLVDPGDEVILLEPFYDCYVPAVHMAGGVPRYVPLHPPQPGETGWRLDLDELNAAFNARTRVILVNTPHNPSGKVFTAEELKAIAILCVAWDVIAITDEVYEHLVYGSARHVRLATQPGMSDRTITIGSLGKSFSFTGWKVGWAIADPALTPAVRRTHQYITFATPIPLQAAAAEALTHCDAVVQALADDFERKRDYLTDVLTGLGFKPTVPDGGYFIVTDVADVARRSGVDLEGAAFCRWLTTEIGVAAIPLGAFYSPGREAITRGRIRFAFCKQQVTLERAAERLQRLSA
jgi:N-succinyldiaminopimelate aminotransferase